MILSNILAVFSIQIPLYIVVTVRSVAFLVKSADDASRAAISPSPLKSSPPKVQPPNWSIMARIWTSQLCVEFEVEILVGDPQNNKSSVFRWGFEIDWIWPALSITHHFSFRHLILTIGVTFRNKAISHFYDFIIFV